MKKIFILHFFILLFLSFGIKAQNASNYAFTTNNNESLTTTGVWTTIVVAGKNHSNYNDGSGNVPASSVINIPFDVWFMGERFTSFNINTNAVLRFGSTPIFSEGNTYNITDHARLCPFSASSTTGGVLDEGDWQTGTIQYQIAGVAPNRILIVQCINMRVSYNSGTSDSNFEMRVQETSTPTVDPASGQITFVYGAMVKGTAGSITSGNIGIGYSGHGAANDFFSVDISTHTASTTATNNTYPTGTITQLNSASNPNRRFYKFNPPLTNQNVTLVNINCVSDNSLRLDWVAAAGNQVGYVIYRSTSLAGPYVFLTQTSALNPLTFTDTGLTAGTTYYYRVLTVTEGKLSAVTGANQVSATTTISPTVYSIASTLWSSTGTWSTSSIPLATQNVIIGCAAPHTVTVNTNGVAKDLTVETGSVLNFNAGQTVTTEGNVTNKGTININGGTLRIKGNLINTTGSTINVGTGTLIVEGNFTNAATATLNGNTGTFRLKGNFTNVGIYNSNTSIMRFDGTAQQLINHTGTSSGQGVVTTANTYNNNAALVSPPSTTSYTNNTPNNIPDNPSPNPGLNKTINVPATTSTITDITVYLDIDHTYVGDLVVTLTSPSGTTRVLMNRIENGGGIGSCNRSNINATLSDAAGNNVQTRCSTNNINGTHRPFQTLAGFDGENPSGNWILNVSDRDSGASGRFQSATLNITTTGSAGLPIPDANTVGVNHTINVLPAGTIQNVRMDIAIDHPYIGNLIVTLRSPAGTTRTMMTRVVNSGDCSTDNLSITFDDLAAASVQTQCGAGTPSINGTYQPSQSLAAFVGENQSGNWIINVADRVGTNIGRIMSANLYITTSTTVPFALSANLYFHKLEMQNTGAGVLTQNTNVHILNTATWTTGVFRATNPFMLIFVDNATSTIGNNASHADMQVRKIGNDAFNFPVGNGGWVAQIGITAPSNVAHHFTAQYFKQVTPFNPFLKEPSIHHVGQCEYWILDRTNGASNVQVTLSYDNVRSCTVGPTAGLKVVRWDGAIWRDHFNGGVIAAPYNGILSLGTVNSFSPFTLGADTKDNILPLTFLSFDAKPFESDAILDWTTTGELNHDYFEVERSINGQDFKGIGKVKNPISIDNTKSTYSFIDKNVGIENTEAYYRLKQIDNDGKFSYSDIKKVNWSIDNSKNGGLFVAYPNPFTDILMLDFSLDKSENIEISLIDMTGRIIKTISQSYSKGNHKVELNYLQNLAKGSYLLQFKTNTIQKTLKVVKM